jgi:hypothetical protein
MSSAFDFDFFWGNFGFLLKLAAPFAVIMVSIYAVGKLLEVIIRAVKSKGVVNYGYTTISSLS